MKRKERKGEGGKQRESFVVKSRLSVNMGKVVICLGNDLVAVLPYTFPGGSGSVEAHVTQAQTNQMI